MTGGAVAGVGDRVRWFEDCDGDSVKAVGGKCASLGELLRAGVEVPCGFALTTACHREFLAATGVNHAAAARARSADLHDGDSVAAATAEVRAMFDAAPLPGAVDEAIAGAYERLAERVGCPDPPVAVRSSATAEDHHAASFAGQLETYLWVQGVDAVRHYVVRCWSAMFEPHTVAYCRQVGVDYEEMVMSVGVQQMVDARSAGVLFTLNPINGDRSKILVESCWGLGEGVVTGEVDVDRFMLDKVTFDILDRHHGNKTFAFRHTGGGALIARQPVDSTMVSAPSLADSEMVTLATLGKRIERHYGRPMDVEWAIGVNNGVEQIFILQARPETVANKLANSATRAPARSALDQVISGMVARGGGEASTEP